MNLVKASYSAANLLARYEWYGLGDQLRRSSISIQSNIAEGSKRNNKKEFYQFCGIARGSAAELETQLLAVQMLYPSINVTDALNLVDEIQRMLTQLIKNLKSV